MSEERAFACTSLNDVGDGHLQEGMSLRDYMAAKAMQGMIASNGFLTEQGRLDCENVAGCAYEIADAMLKARGE